MALHFSTGAAINCGTLAGSWKGSKWTSLIMIAGTAAGMAGATRVGAEAKALVWLASIDIPRRSAIRRQQERWMDLNMGTCMTGVVNFGIERG